MTVKIPKCPHCGKLLATTTGRWEAPDRQSGGINIVWLCPETASPQEPVWVDVKEEGA